MIKRNRNLEKRIFDFNSYNEITQRIFKEFDILPNQSLNIANESLEYALNLSKFNLGSLYYLDLALKIYQENNHIQEKYEKILKVSEEIKDNIKEFKDNKDNLIEKLENVMKTLKEQEEYTSLQKHHYEATISFLNKFDLKYERLINKLFSKESIIKDLEIESYKIRDYFLEIIQS